MGSIHPSGSRRTVGIEEELFLVDPNTGLPVAAIEPILRRSDFADEHQQDPTTGSLLPMIEREAKAEQIELVSPPSDDMQRIEALVFAGRQLADEAAEEVGARAVALATSVLPVTSHAASDPRYHRMQERFGMTFREQLTCGLHVHVSVADDEEGVAVLDRIRPWLPVLHALSTNSPFWQGRDTDFGSFRYQAWGRWPTAGAYDHFGSARAYHQGVQDLVESGVLLDPGMIYFDARLSRNNPTVELRMADVCLDPSHVPTLAALVRALVDTAAEEWRTAQPIIPVPTAMLRAAMWTASRFGIEDDLVDLHLGRPVRARDAVAALLDHVSDALEANGDRDRVVTGLDTIFSDGTGARQQREAYARTRSLSAVVQDAIAISNRRAVGALV